MKNSKQGRPLTHSAKCCFLLLGAFVLLLAANARAQEIEWGIYRINSIDAASVDRDLRALPAELSKARFVGLGETLHTSGGFYRAKVRLIRFLVEKRGFRVFALENPWGLTEAVQEYVQTCSGSAEQVLPGSVFTVWASRSLAELVDWMCEWNRRHPNDRVDVVGFDVQQPRADFDAIFSLFADLDRRGDVLLFPLDNCYLNFEENPEESRAEGCVEAVQRIQSFLHSNRADIVSRLGLDRYLRAEMHAIGLSAHQDQISLPRIPSLEARDLAMSQVFEIQRQRIIGNRKTVLWAHNTHLARDGRLANSYTSLGHRLHQRWGDAYRSVGLFALHTFANWPSVACGGPFFVPETNSLERRLDRLAEPYLLADLGALSNDHPTLPGCTPMSFGTFGSDFRFPDIDAPPNQGYPVPGEHFDYALYLVRSDAMEALPTTPNCSGARSTTATRQAAPQSATVRPTSPPSDGLRPEATAGTAQTLGPQPIDAGACARPSAPNAASEAVGQQSVTISWLPNALSDETELIREVDGREELRVLLDRTERRFSDADLVPGTRYLYRLRHRNRFGYSEETRLIVQTAEPDLSPCTRADDTLCLGLEDRYEVRVEWSTADATGFGRVTAAQSEDSGVFWFFAPDNWEMLVKLLNGCPINGHHWLLVTATTDVGYQLQIRDTKFGAVRRFDHSAGAPARALIDIEAFAGCEVSARSDTAPPIPSASNVPPADDCPDSTLCFSDRFQATVEWQTPRGESGRAQVVPFANTTSRLLWFFAPDNWEMLVKLLDGCAVNGHYWLIYGATTDVAFELELNDTLLGRTKTYRHTGGDGAPSVLDIEAMSCGE